jgi:hypothetical protein
MGIATAPRRFVDQLIAELALHRLREDTGSSDGRQGKQI